MYSDEQRNTIYRKVCDGIASGSSLAKICAAEDMPTKECIRLWLRDDEDFFAQYTRAREMRADARADRIDEIAEEVKAGTLGYNEARIIIDAEKWQAGKENSKRYGDRLQVDAGLTMRMDDAQLESRVTQLIGKAGIAGAFGREGTPEGEA